MEFPIRIDATTLPALIFGGALSIVAIGLAVFVWRTRRSLDLLVESDEAARLHADRQFRRRMQVSGMLLVIGILIPLGDQLDKVFLTRPVLFLAWISAVVFLALWMVLLAVGDWVSTMTYSSIANAQLRFERRELEEQIRRYHALKSGLNHSDNGEHD